jgi:uncharacterized protein YoxC
MTTQLWLLIVNTISAILIAIIGYFVKRTIDQFSSRLDSHDSMLLKLVGDVQRLVGRTESWNGTNRRGRK